MEQAAPAPSPRADIVRSRSRRARREAGEVSRALRALPCSRSATEHGAARLSPRAASKAAGSAGRLPAPRARPARLGVTPALPSS
eukprot:2235435-Alexandrium_andersonii.AAC.1